LELGPRNDFGIFAHMILDVSVGNVTLTVVTSEILRGEAVFHNFGNGNKLLLLTFVERNNRIKCAKSAVKQKCIQSGFENVQRDIR